MNKLLLSLSFIMLPFVHTAHAKTFDLARCFQIVCIRTSKYGGPYDKPIMRAPALPMTVFLSKPYIILSPAPNDNGYAQIIITDDNGMVVKNDTIAVMPEQDAIIYIGDLTSGTYDLNIELESYTLEGSFDVE